MRPSRRHVLIALATATAAAGTPAPLLANPEVTCWQPEKKLAAEAGAEYWTEARMRKAVPEDVTAPADNFGLGTRRLENGSAERAPIAEAPYKVGGKLFYTRGGKDYAASAQFIAEDNIVIGAAHSLYKDENQAQNIRFVQGYATPGGTSYDIDWAAVLTAWTKVADNPPSLGRSQYDYSIMRTTKASTVGHYTLGSANVGDDVTITGYPGRLEDGKYMYQEAATIQVQGGTAYQAGPHPMYGGGASGGAWFKGKGETAKAVAVVSGGNSEAVLGAGFTDETPVVVAYVKGGCK